MSRFSTGEGCGVKENPIVSTSDGTSLQWVEKSRYQSLREYTVIAPHQIEVICHDVLYCSFGGSPRYIISIDPDGGPYLCVGRNIKSYQITKIVSYQQPWKGKKDMMRILLEVELRHSVPTPLSHGDATPTPSP